MSEVTCSVVGDLLPLYVEDLVSEVTRQYVADHLQGCERCRVVLAAIQTEPLIPLDTRPVEPEGQDRVAAGIVARGRRKIRTLWTVVIVSLALCASTVLLGGWWLFLRPAPMFNAVFEKVEVLADRVVIRGSIEDSYHVYKGYDYDIYGADLYVTVKGAVVAPWAQPGSVTNRFEIAIPYEGKIKRVFVVGPPHLVSSF